MSHFFTLGGEYIRLSEIAMVSRTATSNGVGGYFNVYLRGFSYPDGVNTYHYNTIEEAEGVLAMLKVELEKDACNG